MVMGFKYMHDHEGQNNFNMYISVTTELRIIMRIYCICVDA